MGSATLQLRQCALQKSIKDHQLEKLCLSRKLQRYGRLSTMIASGVNLSPDALASVGWDLFGDALDIMGNASEMASAAADEQLAFYETAFNKLSEDNYYTSGLGAQAALYTDENGTLVTDYAREKFYDEAIKQYIEQYIEPIINEEEKRIEEEQTSLETLIQQEEAELQSVKDAKSQAIQQETIKLV